MVRGIGWTAGLALLAGLALSGCATGAGAPVAGGSALPSSPASVSASASPSAAPAPASPSLDAGPRPCAALAVAQLPGDDGAAGTIVVRIQVTNGGTGPCTISGYPDFTLTVHSAAHPVTLVRGQLGGPFAAPATTLTVAPGGHAGFFVAYSNRTDSGDGSCVTADQLRLTQPGSASPSVGPVQLPLCQDTLRVSAYVPSGQLTF